jgi:hypothetical protein
MHKIVDTTAAFRLVGSKVYVCVAGKYEQLTFFYVHMSRDADCASLDVKCE